MGGRLYLIMYMNFGSVTHNPLMMCVWLGVVGLPRHCSPVPFFCDFRHFCHKDFRCGIGSKKRRSESCVAYVVE